MGNETEDRVHSVSDVGVRETPTEHEPTVLGDSRVAADGAGAAAPIPANQSPDFPSSRGNSGYRFTEFVRTVHVRVRYAMSMLLPIAIFM
jgi:hypothetical protein